MGLLALGVVGLLASLGSSAPSDSTRSLSHPTGGFTYRIPETWKVAPLSDRPDVLQVEGPKVLVRFVVRRGELGLDAAHVICMDDRLAGPMEMAPGVKYEEDFLTAVTAGRRVAFSSFVVTYDKPIMGYRKWWQRNTTIVGGGETVCVIGTMPDKLRREKKLRRALESIMDSVSFQGAETP